MALNLKDVPVELQAAAIIAAAQTVVADSASPSSHPYLRRIGGNQVDTIATRARDILEAFLDIPSDNAKP